jgi:Cof subfamily protein (haloacid dehalogenase superfamily)
VNVPAQRPQLVALDVDGTLVGGDLCVSARNLAAIRRAQEAGVRITLVTGRMFRSARPYADALGIEGPIVCYQGAGVFAAPGGELLRHVPLASPIALAIVRRARAEGLHVQLYAEDRFYVETLNPYAELYARVSGVKPVLVESLAAEFAGRDTTKLVVVTDPARAEIVAADLAAEYAERTYVTRSQPEFVEVLDRRVDKGEALRFAASCLGIAPERTLAVGDSWNDVPLLRAAGFAVAMGGAPRDLRDAADAEVADVEHDGVAEALERFVLARAELAS